MVWKMGSISHLTIWEFHVQAYINYAFKSDNVKSVLLWLVERNNVIDHTPQNFMALAYQLIRLGHWSDDGPTGHPGSFTDKKENFNLPIACASSLWMGNSEAISPRNSLVQVWMENGISKLQSLKQSDTSNRFHPQIQQKVIFKRCTRCAFC